VTAGSDRTYTPEQKEGVREILIARLTNFLQVPDQVIDPVRPLAEYGIDSTDLLMLIFDIEEHFGCKFPPSTFFDIETVDDLADRIAASLTKQGLLVANVPLGLA
jgi:acyl carrier protein